MVAAGQLPARPGRRADRRRGAGRRLDAGGGLDLVGGVGPRGARARRGDRPGRALRRVLAGDVVPAKKPAPDIYLLALERLGVEPGEALVVEDSRNGMLAAVARRPALRGDRQQLHGGRGLRRGRAGRVLARRPGRDRTPRCSPNRGVRARPIRGYSCTICERASRRRACRSIEREVWMGESSFEQVELVGADDRGDRGRRTRRTSASWTRSSATATSATRWRAASRSSWPTGTRSTGPTSGRS